jgi:hypothetical protein
MKRIGRKRLRFLVHSPLALIGRYLQHRQGSGNAGKEDQCGPDDLPDPSLLP